MWAQQIPFARPLRDVHFANDQPGRSSNMEPQDDFGRVGVSTAEQSESSPGAPILESETNTTDDETTDKISADVVQQILDALEQIKSRQQQSLHDLQRVSIEIAMHAAHQLLGQRIANGEQDLQNLVRQAIDGFDTTDKLQIRLNPDDLRSIRHDSPTLTAHANAYFVEDQLLQRGNCRVESTGFDLVFDWEAQLNEMRRSLLQRLNDARTEH